MKFDEVTMGARDETVDDDGTAVEARGQGLNSRLIRIVKNQSLRTIILITMMVAIFFINVMLVGVLRLNSKGMSTLGNAFMSNSEISNFTECLSATERFTENYIMHRSFESIDSYFTSKNKLETLCQNLQSNPSSNQVLQKEYVVYQLTQSFLSYSNKAIAARRAYSPDDVDLYYGKTMDCYNLLSGEILELNQLLLQKNAHTYGENLNLLSNASRFSILFMVAISVAIVALLYLAITMITKPLVEISEVAHRISKRDFDVPLLRNNSSNEIGNICQAFNRMIISIREYIDTIWEKARTEAELKEKEIEMQALYTDAQLRALQNQINPHFLFNTLNTGAQLAMMEGADRTCYFIEQVSDFFRYKIQNNGQTASLTEELGLVDNFVYIMKVRFGQRLNFVKNVPDMPLDEQVPIMTLQPLVENCIKHGLRNETGEVLLNVEMREKFVEISVSDNGEGMNEDVRREVFAAVERDQTQLSAHYSAIPENSLEEEKHTGTGLVNVFLRLKLFFHRTDIYDITANEDGRGTKFIIRIPHKLRNV